MKSCSAACFDSIESITTKIGVGVAMFAVATMKAGQLLRSFAN